VNILIVESAAKARTLQSYLGDGWKVLATGGHVRTLPDDRNKHGKDASKAYWANRPGELPSPPWVWTDRGEDAVRKIVDQAGPDPRFWIATDPDREGEFIAWSLEPLLKEQGPTHRVTFDEVTEEAVKEALEHARGVDREMVDSALVRKFLDRLVGYRASKMANSVLPGRGHSMGRVQTPTLGFVVERELEREAHEPIPYFEVHAQAAGVDLQVRFHEPDDEDAWRDEGGKPFPSRTFDREAAGEAVEALTRAGRVRVSDVESRTRKRRSYPPFSTDALLQAGGSRFGWSPRKTSALASMLYEAGHITYIRTDSTRLAKTAVERARSAVRSEFGEDHLGPVAQENVATGPVQDAHEAIRPTRLEVEEPALDDADARRLYRLIRAQTLASQMAPAERTIVSIQAECEDLDLPLTGSVSWRTFAGWEAAYAEFMGDIATAPPDITLESGAVWSLDPATDEQENPRLVEDETKPPPRYRPHTLIRAMKDAGIGRPSTYSRTVEKLEERKYVVLEDGSLVPTDEGRGIWLEVAPLYAEDADETHDEVELFDSDYTALMEERLDLIERGDAPAPGSWEAWRDQVRELHAVALDRRRSGGILPGTRHKLERLLANTPDQDELPHRDRIGELSEREARTLIQELKERGVRPTPTEKQLDYIARLIRDLELTDEDLNEHAGIRDVAAIDTADRASAVIDELQRLYDERKPASAAQRRFIASLMKEAGIEEKDAAGLVGVESLEELTGGKDGSASALIDILQERTAEEANA
jgi:DNA topoisomerase-1